MYRFLLLLLVLGYFNSPIQAQQYLWPTDSGHYLSSTFGETRSAHFHAGLDIKTWGREGYRVFAVRDGVVHRLLITERGYGKAIYLKHDDGTYTVYAHLQRFNPFLQSIADSIRMQDYSFEMEEHLESAYIEVKQGEVIGFTGSSGIGPPHLHFEIRDSLENPINALTTNLSIKDELPPVFSSLIVEPIALNSKINGNAYSTTIAANKSSDGIYDFGEVEAVGKVGLAVDVYDLANQVPNKYAVYSLSLLHESDTLFHQQLNSFSYANSAEMFLDRIAPFGSSRRSHHRLYAKDGSQNSFYKTVLPDAIIIPSDTSITYTIVAADYFGNTSKAQIQFKKYKPEHQNDPVFSESVEKWYWTENWASPDLRSPIDLKSQFGKPWGENHQLLFANEKVTTFSRIVPGNIQQVKTPDYQFLVRFNKEAFFDTLTVALSHQKRENEIHLSVLPHTLAAKSDYKVEYFLGDFYQPEQNLQLFRVKPNNQLSYVPSELIGRTLHASPSSLGNFIIKSDNTAPQVFNFRIEKTDYGQWIAKVAVKDSLSGVDSKTAVFSINGTRGIAEYDYEEDLLIYHLPGFTPEKVNSANIKISDKAGNETDITLVQ